MPAPRMVGLAALICALSQVSCVTWTDEEAINGVTWANDDSEIALVVGRFESSSGGVGAATSSKRNFRHQIYVEQPGGTGRTAVAGELDGQGPSVFYYMKVRGYFVVAPASISEHLVYRIARDGTRREIARVSKSSCEGRDWFDVVPSPDGANIVVLQGANCHSANTPGGTAQVPQSVSVSFLDAATLAVVETQTVGQFTNEVGVNWTWRPGGDFVVTKDSSAWSLAIGRAPIATTRPRCYSPKTTSSDRSSTGRGIHPSGMTVVFDPTVPSFAFGCQ